MVWDFGGGVHIYNSPHPVKECSLSTAGVMLIVNDGFLKRFDESPRWEVVEPGYVGILNLESSQGGPELTMAALPKTGEIVLLEMSQRFHVDHLSNVMDVALKGCSDIYSILDKVVRQHVSKSSASLELGT